MLFTDTIILIMFAVVLLKKSAWHNNTNPTPIYPEISSSHISTENWLLLRSIKFQYYCWCKGIPDMYNILPSSFCTLNTLLLCFLKTVVTKLKPLCEPIFLPFSVFNTVNIISIFWLILQFKYFKVIRFLVEECNNKLSSNYQFLLN